MVKKRNDFLTTTTMSKLAAKSRPDASGNELLDDDESDLSFHSQNSKDGQWRTKIRIRNLSLTPAKIPPKTKKKNHPSMSSTTNESRRHSDCWDSLDFDSNSSSSDENNVDARKIQPCTILLSPRKFRHCPNSSSTGGRQMLTPTTTTTSDGADDEDTDRRAPNCHGRVGWNARHSQGSYADVANASARDAQYSDEDSQDSEAVTTRKSFTAAQTSKRLVKVFLGSDDNSEDFGKPTSTRRTDGAVQTSNRLRKYAKVSPHSFQETALDVLLSSDDDAAYHTPMTTRRSGAAVQTSNLKKKPAKVSPPSYQEPALDVLLSSDDDSLDCIPVTTRRSGAAAQTSNLMKKIAKVSPPSSQDTALDILLSSDDDSLDRVSMTTRRFGAAVQTSNFLIKIAKIYPPSSHDTALDVILSSDDDSLDCIPMSTRRSGAAVQKLNRLNKIAQISPTSSQEAAPEFLSSDENSTDRIRMSTWTSSTALQTANHRKKNGDVTTDSSQETDPGVMLSSDDYSEDLTLMTTRRSSAVQTTNSFTKQAKFSPDSFRKAASSCPEWSDCDGDDARKPAPRVASLRNGKITSAAASCISANTLVHNNYTKYERASPLSLEAVLLNDRSNNGACTKPSNFSTPLARRHSSERSLFSPLRRNETPQSRTKDKCDDADCKAINGNNVVEIRSDVADDKGLSAAFVEEPTCNATTLVGSERASNPRGMSS